MRSKKYLSFALAFVMLASLSLIALSAMSNPTNETDVSYETLAASSDPDVRAHANELLGIYNRLQGMDLDQLNQFIDAQAAALENGSADQG